MHRLYFYIILILIILLACDEQVPFKAVDNANECRHFNNIFSDELWSADSLHTVEKSIYVQNAIVRIEPGAIIAFEEDASLNIMNSGGLIADGSNKRITFTRKNAQSKNWKNIFFASNANEDSCQLIHSTFEYGGNDVDWPAIIYCQQVSPTIRNCEIKHSASGGIYFAGECSTRNFSNNVITQNVTEPVTVSACAIQSFPAGDYSGNGSDFIRVIEGSINQNMVWSQLGLPFRISDDINITGATLTLADSLELYFDSQWCINISGGGALIAHGIEKRIIFSGMEDRSGSWKGIYFRSSAPSEMNNCLIAYGGSDALTPANVYIENASPSFENCRIQYSAGYGVFIRGKYNPTRFVNNLIAENRGVAVSAPANIVSILSDNSYSLNGEDYIEVRGGSEEGLISETDTWSDVGIDYCVTDRITVRSATLFFNPGVKVKFDVGASLDIMEGGGIIADGSAGLISLTGVGAFPGSWSGVYFGNNSNDRDCILKYCLIEYGGGDSSRPANIFCDNASPTISNCTISHSLHYGIYLLGNSNPTLVNNIYTGNFSGPKFP